MNFDLITKHITPHFVVDVGARLGDWAKEAKAVWPDASFILIEANEECRESLKELPFPFQIAVLSDKVKEVDFYTLKDCATGSSYYRENTPFFADDKVKIEKRKTQMLDNILVTLPRELVLHHPTLLKLDTQGSELDILKGGEEFLKNVDAIVCEVGIMEYNIGAPLIIESSKFMADHGFFAAEQLDQIVHPLDHSKIIQVDILFLKLKTYGG